MMVFNRWAIVNTVHPLNSLRIVCWMYESVSMSTAAVASSNTRILDLRRRALAKQTNCRCPTLRKNKKFLENLIWLKKDFDMESFTWFLIETSQVLTSEYLLNIFSFLEPPNFSNIRHSYSTLNHLSKKVKLLDVPRWIRCLEIAIKILKCPNNLETDFIILNYLRLSPPSTTSEWRPSASEETNVLRWEISRTCHIASSECLLKGSMLKRIDPEKRTGS